MPAAEDDLDYIPIPLQDIPDIQTIQQCSPRPTASRQLAPEIEIRLRREGPQENDRDEEHLAARHERWCAHHEIEHGDVDRTLEDPVGGEAYKDGGLS